MTSLLERISLPPTNDKAALGPVRSKAHRAAASGPYDRKQRPPKGDINGTWEHDLYNKSNSPRSLSARLSNAPQSAPKMNFGIADKALREAVGDKSALSIKGASSRGNVIQVSGLVRGTSAADVEAIFKRCGPITSAVLHSSTPDPVVRLTYKHEKDAQAAVAKFHNQPADGRTLEVKIIGGVNATLSGRIGAALVEGSVDVLMSDDTNSGSKLRSDEILATDSRAHVLVAPPGANPKEYTQKPAVRGRGRGRGRARRGRDNVSRMDVDR